MLKYPTKISTIILLLMAPLLANCTDYQRVSIIALLGNPSVYEDKEVMVTGYLKIEHEGNAIYLTEEHADRVLTINAVWLNLTQDQAEKWKALSYKYATVYGKFTSKEKGHFDLFSGSIVEVFNILENPDFESLRLERERLQNEFESKNNK